MLEKIKRNLDDHKIVVKEADKSYFTGSSFDPLLKHYLQKLGFTLGDSKLDIKAQIDEVKKKAEKNEDVPK
jgi:hypothetical protein